MRKAFALLLLVAIVPNGLSLSRDGARKKSLDEVFGLKTDAVSSRWTMPLGCKSVSFFFKSSYDI